MHAWGGIKQRCVCIVMGNNAFISVRTLTRFVADCFGHLGEGNLQSCRIDDGPGGIETLPARTLSGHPNDSHPWMRAIFGHCRTLDTDLRHIWRRVADVCEQMTLMTNAAPLLAIAGALPGIRRILAPPGQIRCLVITSPPHSVNHTAQGTYLWVDRLCPPVTQLRRS